jgi:AcrR family transcriptional regulator
MTRIRIQSSVTTAAEPSPRARILDAADRLLARYGYRKMTVDDIAAEAGIGKGTVYLSFPSKVEVALGCIDRMVEALLVRLRAIAAEARPLEQRVRDMLRERVLHRFDYAQAHASSLDALLAGLRPTLLARRAGHFAAEAAIFEELLRAAARAARAPAPHAARDAASLVTATNALLPYSLSPGELGNRAEVERRVVALSELLVAGLSLAPRPSSPPLLQRRTR